MTALTVIAALNILEQQHALLFFLIDLIIKSTLLLSATWIIQFLIRGSSSSTKSIVWMMAFAGLLLLPLFHELLPNISLSLSHSSTLENFAGTQQSAANFALGVNAMADSLFGAALSYLLICALLCCHLLSGILRVISLTRLARPFRNEIALQALENLQRINGYDRPIQLLISSRVSSPVTWGFWRHKIIFPLAANGWNDDLLQQALSHELGHVQRGDWLLQILSRVALNLYWINPLVWFAHRRLLIETEKACDDVAVENSESAWSYAQNLLALANCVSSQRTPLAPGLLGMQSSLSQRIRHILTQNVNGRSSDTSNILPSLFCAALLIAPFSALNIQLQQVEISDYVAIELPLIPVSFFPNGSQEYNSLMAEFK